MRSRVAAAWIADTEAAAKALTQPRGTLFLWASEIRSWPLLRDAGPTRTVFSTALAYEAITASLNLFDQLLDFPI